MTWFKDDTIPWTCNHCRKAQFYDRHGPTTRWECKLSPCVPCGTTWNKDRFGYVYFEFDYIDVQDRDGDCLLNLFTCHPRNHLKEIWNEA